MQVGTPPQKFDVLLGTKVQNLWVPIADDCARFNSTTCGSSRGVLPFQQRLSPGFQSNASTTWEAIGLYELGIGRNLGITGNGFNGFETIGVENVELTHAPVIAYAAPGFWVGQLGLLPTTLNFSDTISSPSFLRSLLNEEHVPSLSYGYQAGAVYRNAKVPASLVIGGYDSSRASSPPLTVPVGSDFALTLGMQDILATNTLQGTLSLVDSERILAPIDSSVSELWLPRSVCDRFESAFGLQYHEASDRYVLTDAAHDRLRRLSPALSFTVGASAGVGGNTTIIRFPYSAFDLQASFPIFAEATNYFPIRRASNESQYAIGRVFLQEAYLGVDWEREEFNVSQAIYANPMPAPKIITIPSMPSHRPSDNTQNKSKGLSGEAIAGIAIGCVLAVGLVLGFLGYKCGWKRKTTQDFQMVEQFDMKENVTGEVTRFDSELSTGDFTHELHAGHGQSELRRAENGVYELPTGSDLQR